MGNARYRDAVISGSGRIAGGQYEDVKISGSGEIDGDIIAEEVKSSGSAQFHGDVAARSVKVSGSARFRGNVDTQDCRVSGSAKISGHLHAERIQTSGSLQCDSSIRAEEIKVSGHVKVDGDAEAELFKASGSFKIHGLLNASEVQVNLGGICRAREVGGDRIEVRVAPINLFWKAFLRIAQFWGKGSRFGFRAELIEGTNVALEWTEARVVRGQEVRIGPGCNVGLVEYTHQAYVHPQAQVAEVRQII